MNCSNCNAWIPEDAAFCPECGHKAEPAAPAAGVFCGNCGAPMAADEMFCGNCGAKVESEGKEKKDKKLKLPGKGIPKKALVLGAAAVAVIAVLILVISLIGGGGSSDAYAVYIKDSELYSAQLPKLKDPMELTSRMLDGGYDSSYVQSSMYIDYLLKLSSDGKTMFYPDKMEVSDYGSVYEFTLYCRNVSNPKKEPVKIDSGIAGGYSLNEAGNLVTYLKDDNLYQHNLKEKTKIDSDVTSYRVSKDGKTLLYLVWDYSEDSGDLYLKTGSKDAEKVASSVTGLSYANEDVSIVLFMKEDALYRMEPGKEPEKISSEVNSVLGTYENGACYYTKQEESEITYWSVVDDDVPSDDYDYTREWMKEETFYNPVQSLYYYDGAESILITESMVDYHSYSYENTPMVTYSALEGNELPKVKFSKYVEEYIDLSDMLDEAIDDDSIEYLAVNGTVMELGLEEVRNAAYAEDGKTVYVGAEYDAEDSTYSLYKLEISGDAVKNSELLNDEVYSHRVVNESSVLYWNDINDDYEGELFLDGNKVDDDVYIGYCTYTEDLSCLYYMVDWNSNKGEGTLKCYKGKKAVEIKDDARGAVCTPDGDVLFLYDFSTNSYKGELWKWSGKKAEKIDEDVSRVFIVK